MTATEPVATDSAAGRVSWSFASPTSATPASSTSSAAIVIVVPGSGMDTLQRYEYTGRELASETSGYYFFRYRAYGPALGQFFTRDPLAYVDGLGLYVGRFSLRGGRDACGRQEKGGCEADLADNPAQGIPYMPGLLCFGYAACRLFAEPPVMIDCDGLRKHLKQNFEFIDVPEDGCCPKGFHKVHFRVGERDYHFYRQDRSGRWSHVLGDEGLVMDTDAGGKPITDVERAAHDYTAMGAHNYATSCGFLCARTEMTDAERKKYACSYVDEWRNRLTRLQDELRRLPPQSPEAEEHIKSIARLAEVFQQWRDLCPGK